MNLTTFIHLSIFVLKNCCFHGPLVPTLSMANQHLQYMITLRVNSGWVSGQQTERLRPKWETETKLVQGHTAPALVPHISDHTSDWVTGERQRKETGETEHSDDDNEWDNNNDMLADFVNKRKQGRLNYWQHKVKISKVKQKDLLKISKLVQLLWRQPYLYCNRES